MAENEKTVDKFCLPTVSFLIINRLNITDSMPFVLLLVPIFPLLYIRPN